MEVHQVHWEACGTMGCSFACWFPVEYANEGGYQGKGMVEGWRKEEQESSMSISDLEQTTMLVAEVQWL